MMMTAREPIDPATVRQVDIFRTLDDAEVRQICALLKERRYRKGEIICYQGDPGDCVYIVGAGRVRIYLISSDGREATIRIFGRGSAFGEFSVLDGGPRSTYAAALDDVTTLVLYREDFLNLLRANFELVQHVIAMLTERLRYTTNYSENLAHRRVWPRCWHNWPRPRQPARPRCGWN
jgi:CRP-like cAMP-binding protein